MVAWRSVPGSRIRQSSRFIGLPIPCGNERSQCNAAVNSFARTPGVALSRAEYKGDAAGTAAAAAPLSPEDTEEDEAASTGLLAVRG